MWKTILLPVLLAILLSGCATTGVAEPEVRIVDTGCSWTKAIYVSNADILSDGTADAILAHNLTGAAKCGWKPTAKK